MQGNKRGILLPRSPWSTVPMAMEVSCYRSRMEDASTRFLSSTRLTESGQTSIVCLAHAPTGRLQDNHLTLHISPQSFQKKWHGCHVGSYDLTVSVCTLWWTGKMLSASTTLQACDFPWERFRWQPGMETKNSNRTGLSWDVSCAPTVGSFVILCLSGSNRVLETLALTKGYLYEWKTSDGDWMKALFLYMVPNSLFRERPGSWSCQLNLSDSLVTCWLV